MSIGTIGLHHVTAMSVDPVETLRFYRNVLKLRLVKWTVNFDQPDIHHFYFGDEDGQPGTLVTLFPFPDAGRGHVGSGGIEAISLAIPEAMLERWILHLVEMGIIPTALGCASIGPSCRLSTLGVCGSNWSPCRRRNQRWQALPLPSLISDPARRCWWN